MYGVFNFIVTEFPRATFLAELINFRHLDRGQDDELKSNIYSVALTFWERITPIPALGVSLKNCCLDAFKSKRKVEL